MKRYFHDAEELSATLKHTSVAAMQISHGSFEATWMPASIHNFSLQYIDFRQGAAVCTGDAPPNGFAMVVPLRLAPGCRLLGQSLERQTIGFYTPGSEHADLTVAGCQEVVIVVPPDALDQAGENLELPKRGSYLRRASLVGLDRLRDVLMRIPDALESPDRLLSTAEPLRGLSDTLGRAIVGTLRSEDDLEGGSLGRPKLPRAAILRRITEILGEPPDQPIHAGELAAALGISQPTLQRVFQEWYGMSPARYLALRRLYLARRRLRSGNSETVTRIAGASGFWDLSRFARSYKAIFGELPSETLRATRLQ